MKNWVLFSFLIIIFSFRKENEMRNFSPLKDSKVIKILTSKRWELSKFDENMKGETKSNPVLKNAAHPNFLSNGIYIDVFNLKLDSAGNFSKRGFRWALGSWKYKSKRLSVKIDEYSKDFGERIFGGEMELVSITETDLVLFKQIAPGWTRTYYLTTY